jgi:hypothetical protein
VVPLPIAVANLHQHQLVSLLQHHAASQPRLSLIAVAKLSHHADAMLHQVAAEKFAVVWPLDQSFALVAVAAQRLAAVAMPLLPHVAVDAVAVLTTVVKV